MKKKVIRSLHRNIEIWWVFGYPLLVARKTSLREVRGDVSEQFSGEIVEYEVYY